MADVTPETGHFGLTRIGSGEQFSKNGYAFSDLDRIALDKILYAAITHSHDGSNRLPDPTVAPGLTTSPLGGTLPAGTTFYYRVSLVDKYGLETSASLEGSVTTPPPLPAPTAPSSAVQTTGGTVGPGTWGYQITYITSTGGETTPSGANSVQVTSGTTNRIQLTLPALPTGASGFRIYRSRPGQTQFYYLDQTVATTYYDPVNVEDQTITVPTVNTTNSTNSITITIPGGTIPLNCLGWKVYRALDSGGYDGNSLVHFVIEGSSDVSTDITVTYTDTGSSLLQGFPKNISSTIPGGTVVGLNQVTGQIPLTSTPRGGRVLNFFGPGVTTSRVLGITNSPTSVIPLRLTAYFRTPYTDAAATPLPIRIRVLDSAATPNYVELVCPNAGATPGPNANYYVLKLPDYLAQSYEAEVGVRSSLSQIPIVTDVAASNGQAVALTLQGHYVQQTLGILSAGNYQLFSTVKVPTYAAGSNNDLTISAVRADNLAVLATSSFSPGINTAQTVNYVEYTGPVFTADGVHEVLLQVSKSTTTGQSYYVDTYRYSATVPTLIPGDITVQAFVDGTNTTASDVNVALWF